MPRINQYSENATIENDDKVLTYDTQAAATKITPFSTIWNWIVSKLHALTSSGAALTPSTDRVIMDKNGTMTRVEPAAVAKYGIETYNGSTIAGSAQTVQSAINALNSNLNHHELLIFSDKPVTTAYASTGASFTLAKTSIVRITHVYDKTLPVTIGVKSSESATAGSIAYTENSGKVENVGYISVTAILNPGTYYIWASAKIASTNNFRVEVYFAI